jgi:hypothetical protein
MLQCETPAMGLLDYVTSLFGTLRIDTPARAENFLESRAAYLAQKSISEYSQARANMMFSTLLGEKTFKAAYEEARWRGYAAALSMVAEVMAGHMRSRQGLSAGDANSVALAMGVSIIAKMRNHSPMESEFWDKAATALEADLARAGMGAPHEAHAVVHGRAEEIFRALPFHAAIKQHDLGMFRNTLSFHLTEIATELEEAKVLPAAFVLSSKVAS